MKGASILKLRSGEATGIRDTSAQDVAIDPEPARRRRRRIALIGGGAALLLVLVIVPTTVRWLNAGISVPADRVRIATVTRGPLSATSPRRARWSRPSARRCSRPRAERLLTQSRRATP